MKYGKNVRQALAMITQFGIDMLVPIVLCSLIGRLLDVSLGTSWIFILLFFVGAVAGARNVYRAAVRIAESGSGDVRNRDHATGIAPDGLDAREEAAEDQSDERDQA